MDFTLTEEQQMLRDSVEKFVEGQYNPNQRDALLHAPDAFSAAHWQTFAELGWLTIPFSEAQGGFGGGIVEVAALTEVLGGALALEPYLETVLLAGQLLARGGADSYLEKIMGGELQAAFAWQERQSRYCLSHCETRATRRDDGFLMNGQKVLVGNADAELVVVSARTAGEGDQPEGISLFVLPADSAGMTRTRLRLMDGREAMNITFNDCLVPTDSLLGEQDQAMALMEPVVEEAIVALCAEAVGAMEYLYKATVEYSKTRKQFGQAIGKFQVLQHRMVDMFMHTEQCRSMLVKALCAISDNSDERSQDVAALKAMVGKYSRKVAEEAVQIHGAMGVTHEMNIGHYLKRMMMIDVSFGDADYHRRRFCQLRYAA